MKKLSVVVISVILSIAGAALVPAVSAQIWEPNAKITYSYEPLSTIEKVTGGGCKIPSPMNPDEQVTFGFVAQYKDGETEPSGNLQFNDHATGMKVHSESIDTLIGSGNNAIFTGTAKVNGKSRYNFTVYVEDNGEPGKDNDTFAISINLGEGFEYHANGTLGGGNIQIHNSSVETPTTNLPIVFDASESYDPDGTIVAYRWDFDGDGIWDIEENVVTITHSYPESGYYTVILEVEDDAGVTNVTTITITVCGCGEGKGEGISGNVTWNGEHTFEGLESKKIIGDPLIITATAHEIKNNVNASINVTIELYVDGFLLNWATETLGPYEQKDIPVSAT
ncbi:MAG: PKD domain-containing protein [archaeon]|nr:PKD domain-containing protein [archaeon]